GGGVRWGGRRLGGVGLRVLPRRGRGGGGASGFVGGRGVVRWSLGRRARWVCRRGPRPGRGLPPRAGRRSRRCRCSPRGGRAGGRGGRLPSSVRRTAAVWRGGAVPRRRCRRWCLGFWWL